MNDSTIKYCQNSLKEFWYVCVSSYIDNTRCVVTCLFRSAETMTRYSLDPENASKCKLSAYGVSNDIRSL